MLKFTHLLLIFLIILLSNLVSCKSNKKMTLKTAKTEKMTKQEISFKIVLQTGNSNISEQKNIVITNKETLLKIYSKINMTRKPGLPIPKIDFSKNVILGFFMGTKNNGGYSIQIERINSNGKEIVVFYKENKPKGMVTMVITQPCLLISIEKRDLPVKFKLVK